MCVWKLTRLQAFGSPALCVSGGLGNMDAVKCLLDAGAHATLLITELLNYWISPNPQCTHMRHSRGAAHAGDGIRRGRPTQVVVTGAQTEPVRATLDNNRRCPNPPISLPSYTHVHHSACACVA
jgi:hypothetical protein